MYDNLTGEVIRKYYRQQHMRELRAFAAGLAMTAIVALGFYYVIFGVIVQQ